ncbi:hypothetical protein F5Y19DRAFT_474533 [Xylariaceae sp. FL1651]|nr:hypothetical protein F5Y19DRAFT_474533 [Xylariaceae sp. FL1651]
MAPNKTNFKTYDASTRLLAAVIATCNPKLDYAELAKHVGGDTTKDAVNHRLRPIKQLAKMQAACVKADKDPGELPVDKGALAGLVGGGATPSALEHRMRPVKQLAKMQTACRDAGGDPGELPADKGEIQKLFGESTPQGIEWRFREIKSLGKAQKEAVAKNENPAALQVASTPSAGRGRAATGTPGSRAPETPGSGTRTPAARGRKRKEVPVARGSDSDDDDDDNTADGDVEETPSKRLAAKRAKSAAATPAKTTVATTAATSAATSAEATPSSRAATSSAGVSLFGDGNGRLQREAFLPVMQSSTEPVGAGLQMVSPGASARHPAANKPVAKPSVVKQEYMSSFHHEDPFLGADSIGGYDDQLEDGEI